MPPVDDQYLAPRPRPKKIDTIESSTTCLIASSASKMRMKEERLEESSGLNNRWNTYSLLIEEAKFS